MPKEHRIIKEVRAIREQMYEKTKEMTMEERIDYFTKDSESAFADLGIKPIFSKIENGRTVHSMERKKKFDCT